jgi:VWFA-related protein
MTTDSKKIFRPVLILFIAFFPGLLAAPAQQPQSAGPSPSHSLQLDVAVDAKSGQPAVNLTQQDFTILDNKTPRPITSFRIMSPAKEQVEVILFIDAVNTPFEMVAYIRQSVGKFLQANEGQLTHPTAIAVFTDQGVQIDPGFSTDGNALNDSLAHHTIGLRQINRSSQWGWLERQQICINAFHELLTFAATLPGRKIVLWISPGWPLVSGPEIYLTGKQEQQTFSTIVSFSTRMRQENVTVYNINPVGAGQSLITEDYYQVFLKGATGPNNVKPGSLGVQVLATQSGGLAIEGDSDVTGNIKRCLNDVQSWYEITFDPLPADKPNEYHHIEIKLDKPGLIARTRTGYYANPRIIEP